MNVQLHAIRAEGTALRAIVTTEIAPGLRRLDRVEVGQAGGEGDRGGVAQVDAVEAAQHGQQGGPGGEAVPHGLFEQGGEELAGGLAYALVEGLGGDVDVEVLVGEVGEVLQGGGVLGQQAEDHGLGENRAAQLAFTQAEAGLAGQAAGGVVEQVVQHAVQFRYTEDHRGGSGAVELW